MNSATRPDSATTSVGPQLKSAHPARSWRESWWLAALEFAIVGLIFFLDWRHLIPISKTPFLLLLAWASMRLRGVRWRDVGFARYRNWPRDSGPGLDRRSHSGNFSTRCHSATPGTAHGQTARPGRFSNSDRKYQMDPDRVGAYLDSRSLRRGVGVARLSDEPRRRPGEPHASCLGLLACW